MNRVRMHLWHKSYVQRSLVEHAIHLKYQIRTVCQMASQEADRSDASRNSSHSLIVQLIRFAVHLKILNHSVAQSRCLPFADSYCLA